MCRACRRFFAAIRVWLRRAPMACSMISLEFTMCICKIQMIDGHGAGAKIGAHLQVLPYCGTDGLADFFVYLP